MVWLSRILAALLAATICLLVIIEVFDHTVLSNQYIENHAAQINAYPRLSDALSSELAKDINQPGVSQSLVELRLKNILSPQVLQSKISTALNGLAAYYKGSSTLPPTIDLTNLVAQARTEGIKVPNDNQLSKPIVLGSNIKARGVGHSFENLKLAELAIAALLLAALIFTSWKRHRYAVLPDIAIVCGVLLGIVAIIFEVSSKVADHFIKFNFNSNAFAVIAHDLALNLLHSIGQTIGIVAVILFIVGLVARILLTKFQPKPKPQHPMPQQPIPKPNPV